MDYWVRLSILLVLSLRPTNALQTDFCDGPLGMKDDKISDQQITASSYYDNAVNAYYGRAHAERGGGAWCPREMIHNRGTEFIEIDLNSLHVLTKVEVQGRFGNGQGREYAEKYKLQYWREGLNHWITYKDGREDDLLEGNSNTYLAKTTRLKPPVVVSKVRFLPYSDHPRTICMRVELYGCPYKDGLVSYSMEDGDTLNGDRGLKDITYDGNRDNGKLSGGLGQLTDGETGHSNFRVDAIGKGNGYEWVGWRNDTRGTKPVEINFEFDVARNFSAIHIYTNNLFTRDVRTFSGVRVLFSAEGKHFTASPPIEFTYTIDRIFDQARNISINLQSSSGKFVKVQLFFSLRWMMVSEISFNSVPCKCNLTDNETMPVISSFRNDTSNSVLAPESTPRASSGLMLGGLLTLGIMFGIVPAILSIYYYKIHLRKSKIKSHTLTSTDSSSQVTMKMKDLHINMNLMPTSNGYSRANGILYGHVQMDEEVSAMYQEPYKGYNSGYYTTETVLKDEVEDYAVPNINMTPPPTFSEAYTTPPPVPISKPPLSLPERIIPSLPPPPEKQYFTAPQLCQASNIQGVTGSVIYSMLDSLPVMKAEVAVPEIPRHRISVLENLGEGLFGIVQLCEIDRLDQTSSSHSIGGRGQLALLKSLKLNAGGTVKKDFRSEVKLLSQLNDQNIVQLIGIMTRQEPLTMVLEYLEHGDLYQFLRRHVCDGVSMRPIIIPEGNSTPPVLSYGALIYMGMQIASGMKYLESLNIVHRDLSSRNCLVGRDLTIKISDFGMSRPLYTNDYYKVEGHTKLPVRWMAWESVIQGCFTLKSDVWAFGVTMWEILTMARKQPFNELSDEGVIENLSHCFHNDDMTYLPQPPICPKAIYEMLLACWRPNAVQRPPFWELQVFLQRKNLCFSIDFVE